MLDRYPQLGLATNRHHNGGMADWHRLGQLVTARRVALGYRRREDLTTAFDGVSQRTLGDIETARKAGYHRNTLATLEHALQWAPGSIQAILTGGEPTPAPASANYIPSPITQHLADAAAYADTHPVDPALIRVMRSPDLTDEQKARIMRSLIAEQERFAERRADELIRQALGETS